MVKFYKFLATDQHFGDDRDRILAQVKKVGFSGGLKIYDLGFDFEDSISLVVEGMFEGEQCCVAVGYGMNRNNLAI